MIPRLSNAHILIVDDESINLTIMEISLEEQGCKVSTFRSAEECLKLLRSTNLKNYDCLITDYSMPGISGIDLLEKVKALDPTLEVILVTGENERFIIQESLRHGAFDFLDKPLELEKFYQSVERAVVATSLRRKRDATEASLLAARSAGMFNTVDTLNWSTHFELTYTPKHELGGDFIEVFETPAGQRCAVFGDISGHDIQSALLSSHFLGSLVGRRAVQSPLDIRQMLEDYNSLLLRRAENLGNSHHVRVGSSLSACTIELVEQEQYMQLTNCGLPALYLIDLQGDVQRLEPEHYPLGWFEDFQARRRRFRTSEFACLLGFTDGLVEFAMKHHWDVLSLIHHLRTLNKSDTQNFLINADDDILFANIRFNETEPDAVPILYDHYHGDACLKVDRYQSVWKRSLELLFPQGKSTTLERFVLACREAVLNAMKHGCQGSAEQSAEFCVKYRASTHTLEAIVRDPGPGHNFDFELRDQQLEHLKPGNLGLVLISKLVDEMQLEHNGSQLRLKMKL